MKNVALILAGAVTQGAFEAGALEVIAERGIPVRRVVAASSGALNGVAYVAGVRARREALAVGELVELWLHHSRWYDVFRLNIGSLFAGAGLSDQTGLLTLLRDRVRPCDIADPAPVDLHIVVAPVDGSEARIGDRAATTYERVLRFEGKHFDSRELLEQVFEAAVATAAFPGVFAPALVKTNDVGPCFDGGVVNNSPIDSALDDGQDESISTVILIAPTPLHTDQPCSTLTGTKLLSQLVHMLINERLYRDLRKAEGINLALGRLSALAQRKGWSDQDLEDIKAELNWTGRRVINIVQIRPEEALPGNAFSGFFSQADIKQYLDAGRKRATAELDRAALR